MFWWGGWAEAFSMRAGSTSWQDADEGPGLQKNCFTRFPLISDLQNLFPFFVLGRWPYCRFYWENRNNRKRPSPSSCAHPRSCLCPLALSSSSAAEEQPALGPISSGPLRGITPAVVPSLQCEQIPLLIEMFLLVNKHAVMSHILRQNFAPPVLFFPLQYNCKRVVYTFFPLSISLSSQYFS